MYGKMKPESKKPIPAGLMAAMKKAKPMPSRGQRTATNMASKAKKK